jgi:hypothetical protein
VRAVKDIGNVTVPDGLPTVIGSHTVVTTLSK